MTQQEIMHRIGTHRLLESTSICGADAAVAISARKGNLLIEVTLPVDAMEIFFQATDDSTGTRVDDWHDFYGQNAEVDYAAELDQMLEVMRSGDVRLSQDGRTVEFRDAEWRYMFGHLDVTQER